MRLLQLSDAGGRFVAVRFDDGALYRLRRYDSVYALARQAADDGAPLISMARALAGERMREWLAEAPDGVKALPPLDHPEPARLMISGTGLTHLGSARARDDMHAGGGDDGAAPTDSMRMFRLGVEGGKPAREFFGAQPEWFYKGDGDNLVAPGGDLARPAYASNGGEEPEIAGVYVIDKNGRPRRAGFALGNEYSDHVMEKQNYLWLAHSKLRQCALGPELLLGDLPAKVEGVSVIRRRGEVIWQKPFFSGEENMCHSIANLERHHFKYDGFCRPGDVHVHFFGTATLSFADGVSPRDGDEFIISAPAFGQPLINRLREAPAAPPRDVLPL